MKRKHLDIRENYKRKYSCNYCPFFTDDTLLYEKHMEDNHGRYSLEKHKQSPDSRLKELYLESIGDKPRRNKTKRRPPFLKDLFNPEDAYNEYINKCKVDIDNIEVPTSDNPVIYKEVPIKNSKMKIGIYIMYDPYRKYPRLFTNECKYGKWIELEKNILDCYVIKNRDKLIPKTYEPEEIKVKDSFDKIVKKMRNKL